MFTSMQETSPEAKNRAKIGLGFPSLRVWHLSLYSIAYEPSTLVVNESHGKLFARQGPKIQITKLIGNLP